MATIHEYQTSTGGTKYEVRYRTPDRRTTRKRGFASKRQANDWAAEVEVGKRSGTYVSPSAGKITIGELGPAWLKRDRGHMKPSGFRSYDSAWRIHVEPRWGRTPITAILKTDVQAWISSLATEPTTGRKIGEDGGLGASTIETVHRVLKMILDDAVEDRRILANPAQRIRLPKRTAKANIYLTHEQVFALAAEAKQYGPLILLLCYCGPRWGEVAGLRVGHIDFLKRRIKLQENAVMVGTKVVVGTLKGHKFRDIPMPRFVGDELARVCRGKGHGDILWPSRDGGYMGPPASIDSWLSGAVSRCIKAANEARARETQEFGAPKTPVFPRVTAHDLRHTAASLAVKELANPKVIQRMMGHKSAAMTLDVYADLFEDDLDLVADRLDQAVSKMRPSTSAGSNYTA